MEDTRISDIFDSWDREGEGLRKQSAEYPGLKGPKGDFEEDRIIWALAPTWWLEKDDPGFDDIYDQGSNIAGDGRIQKMEEKYGVYAIRIKGDPVLYLARFEFPKYQENFQYPEAMLQGGIYGFIDFLTGFPIENEELLLLVGEWSSETDQMKVKDGFGFTAPPLPETLFGGVMKTKLLFNFMYLPENKLVKIFPSDLHGEPKPRGLHWWLRVNLAEPEEGALNFPVPGELLALGVRMMPDQAWGKQKSSPFIFSANFMDTVYYSSATIKEIQDPDDTYPFPRYKVSWRKGNQGSGEYLVAPTDFSEYAVGDRVTILKDVATEKQSQLWRDDDMRTFGKNWQIAPLLFYQKPQ